MKAEKIREKLFTRYSSNWQLIRPFAPFKGADSIDSSFHDAVYCPICMMLFNRNALDQNVDNPLTIEHCPPEELGGKPLILLCKKCNNTAGHELDVKLMEYFDVKPFNEQQSQSRVLLKNTNFESNSTDVRGTMELKRLDANSFYVDLKATDTYRKEKFDSILKGNSIQITYKPHETPPAHVVHTALLKIAYLLAYSKFGHPFILNRNYDGIREQIVDTSKTILPYKGVILRTSLPIGFHLIVEPKHMIGLVVVFPLTHNGKKDISAVILNHPDVRDIDFYTELKKYENITYPIRPLKINDLDYLSNLEHLYSYLEAVHSISPLPKT